MLGIRPLSSAPISSLPASGAVVVPPPFVSLPRIQLQLDEFLTEPSPSLTRFIQPVVTAPIQIVQAVGANKTNVSGNTLNLVFPSNVASGNVILVFVNSGSGSGTVVASDTLLSSYVVDQAGFNGSGAPVGQLVAFHGKAPSSGSNTVTISANGTSNMAISAYAVEVAGLYAPFPLDQVSAKNGSSTTPTTNSVTTKIDTEIICVLAGTPIPAGAITFTDPSGYAQGYEYGGTSTSLPISVVLRIVAAHAAFSPSWTISPTEPWGTILVTYRIAPPVARRLLHVAPQLDENVLAAVSSHPASIASARPPLSQFGVRPVIVVSYPDEDKLVELPNKQEWFPKSN